MATLNELLAEADKAMTRKQAEMDLLKEIKQKMVDEHDISTKKVANRMIRAFHKGNIETEIGDDEEFEELVTKVKNGQ